MNQLINSKRIISYNREAETQCRAIKFPFSAIGKVLQAIKSLY